MKTVKSLALLFTVSGCGVGITSAHAQLRLSLLANVDLAVTANSASAQFIGSNPSAVAWDGTTAWIGGYNASGAVANTAVVRVSDVLATPTFGTAFGQFNTNNTRGLTGLAVRGNVLAASLDNGSGSGDSIRAFNAVSGSVNWRIGDPGAASDSSRRGIGGVAFDPGFNGGDATPDIAFLTIGSGRRHRLDVAAGMYTDGQNGGMLINHSGGNTTWRDLAFDPATGDLYARESNRIAKGVRLNDNSLAGSATTLIGGLSQVATVDNQNIAFLSDVSGLRDILIVNDRTVTSGGQAFSSVVKAFDTTGNPLSITLDGLTPNTGNGAYDFSYNAASGTLAMTDFSNRRLYVFAASVPGPSAVLLLAAGAAPLCRLLARRRVRS